MRKLALVGAAAFCISVVPVPLSAQTNLVDQMTTLFVQNIVLAKTPGGAGVVAHTPIFLTDPNVTNVTSLIGQVSQQIGAQASLFPIGSSSGGFTYGYDSSLGTFARTTNTFGPAFAERAITVGKNKFSFGVNYLHTSYDSLDGLNLSDGTIKFNLLHQALTPPSYVQGDVIQAALQMKFSSDTTALLFNYGVTNRLDLGFAVPVLRVNMDLTYHATILDFATHAVSPTTHLFSNGGKVQDSSTNASASGIGDVVVLAKYNILRQGSKSVAVAVDLTLPSGDEKNMLGTGATLTKFLFIASGGDKVSPHINVGYTVAGGESNGISVSNQWNYTGGVEYAPAPKVTLLADLVGRTLTDALRFNATSVPHQFQQGPTAPIETTMLQTIGQTTGSASSGLGALGVKWNPAGQLLISAHVLLPFTEGGLKAGATPVIGFEYSF